MSDLTDQQIKDNLARALSGKIETIETQLVESAKGTWGWALEPMENETTKPLPCPFCGADDIRFREGSTFRWIVAYCVYCDAQCGEVRRNSFGSSK